MSATEPLEFATKGERLSSEGEIRVGTSTLPGLDEIQKRVLWLATRMIDEANHRNGSAIKVGGHQASSASMVSIMTALWFAHLQANDKVAVKPHASPVYHAIQYLIGNLEEKYLTELRALGGLQAYPSRTKDPDVSDFSTGSVGLGAVAPLFAAVVRRYIDSHYGVQGEARFIALAGDAELDEGNIWEAISDPITRTCGNFMLVVDLNRQSLDRVIPGIQAKRLSGFFEQAGWHTQEVKYGRRLQAAFESEGGLALREHIDLMSNEQYQELFTLKGDALRRAFLIGASPDVLKLSEKLDDDQLFALATDLGGHDLDLLIEAFRECDRETARPSVVFAYTIKGWGLPIAGDPMNHSALLTPDQLEQARSDAGRSPEDEWAGFDPDSLPGVLCGQTASRLERPPTPARPVIVLPNSTTSPVTSGSISSQEAFGRSLSRLADRAEIAERLVTVSPDVAVTTNLGGWINKVGVFSSEAQDDHGGASRLVKWVPSPLGRHIELGISEMNLFMLLGQLGLSHEHHGEQLLPIGAVYDPFVLRGLDALVYGAYNDSRFVFVGTPSGVTLAPEGGAHQSAITASIGLELPNVTYAEPCFSSEVDWMLCRALGRLGDPDGESTYLRLSTRPIDQQPFEVALDHYGETRLRRLVLDGGYRLKETNCDGRPAVTIVTTGVMSPEALEAADELDDEGVGATVVHLTSPDLLYRSWRDWHREGTRTAARVRTPSHLHRLIEPNERKRPIVSVQDAASHSLSWLGSALGTTQIALGVDRFGESGTIEQLHDLMGISAGDIVNAALLALYEKY